MANSPEIQALSSSDDVVIADRNTKTKQTIGIAALLLGGAAAIGFIFANSGEERKNPLENEEQFQTTNFRPPSYIRNEAEPTLPVPPAETNILQLPTPPPVIEPPAVQSSEFNVPAPPPPVEAPPAPVVVQADGTPAVEAPEEPQFPSNWKSKSVVLDSGATSEANAPGTEGADGKPVDPLVAGVDKSSKFLAAVATVEDRAAQARKIERIDAFVPEGTLIPGILETAINSDLPGQVRAVVSRDVYSFDGRRILLPIGTRLIGEYESGISTGQSRIFIVWTRLLRDDGVTIRLNSIGTDSLGRSGLTGFVDKKFKERFGATILLSVIGGVTSYVAGLGGNATTGTVGNNLTDGQQAEQQARQTLSETFSDIANEALKENLKIPPTIFVDQGERIFVYVRQDLDFSALYKSPVEEEIDNIKRERGITR
jgi:type IV secretion system protein VirB10